jgi:hypothetical protein
MAKKTNTDNLSRRILYRVSVLFLLIVVGVIAWKWPADVRECIEGGHDYTLLEQLTPHYYPEYRRKFNADDCCKVEGEMIDLYTVRRCSRCGYRDTKYQIYIWRRKPAYEWYLEPVHNED